MKEGRFIVGVCTVDLKIHQSRSLKTKRQMLARIVKQLQHHFPVSVAEVGETRLWQRAQLGVAMVGREKNLLYNSLQSTVDFIEKMGLVEVLDHRISTLYKSEFFPD